MTPAEARDLVMWDWLVSSTWNRLHHAALTDDQLTELVDDCHTPDVTLTCGRRAKRVGIPGVFTRMGAPRCQRCCDRLGYPHGIGSPKNDDACRVIIEANA